MFLSTILEVTTEINDDKLAQIINTPTELTREQDWIDVDTVEPVTDETMALEIVKGETKENKSKG